MNCRPASLLVSLATAALLLPLTAQAGKIIWPCSGSVSSPYGPRSSPCSGCSTFHRGIDIGVGTGTILGSPGNGTVSSAGWDSCAGNMHIIGYENGWDTRFFHCSEFLKGAGTGVTRNVDVAKSGGTGSCTTGPHLHFEVRKDGVAQSIPGASGEWKTRGAEVPQEYAGLNDGPPQINPPHWFASGTEGWVAGNGMGAVNWTNQFGWPGVIYADQLGNDGFLMGPQCNFAGTSNFDAAVNVKVYVGGGTSANHDMKLYWVNNAEPFWDEAKGSKTANYTIQNGWRVVNLDVTSLKWGAMWIKQLRLDLDANSVGARFHIDRINIVDTPRYHFNSSGQGFTASGMGTINWTNLYGWPGIIYADQVANDGMFFSPVLSNFLGGANDKVKIRLNPQGGTSASHDIQVFWATSGENFYTTEKSTPVTNYTAQNSWVEFTIPVGPWKWEDHWITRLRVDVDNVSKGTRWHIDSVSVEH